MGEAPDLERLMKLIEEIDCARAAGAGQAFARPGEGVEATSLRDRLVTTTLVWERAFGNAPLITTVLSEFDAAMLVGCSPETYSASMQGCSAVQKGHDFEYQGARYQVKGNRPSGKPGSFVTWVPKATNYEWDYLIWVLYNRRYDVQEAWQWDVDSYREAFDNVKRLSPAHLRMGRRLA